jgi:hypothetical protein
MSYHTAQTIKQWADTYTFVNNATASKDILSEIVRNLPDHSYTFGPTEAGGYQLQISGPAINQTFVVKQDS